MRLIVMSALLGLCFCASTESTAFTPAKFSNWFKQEFEGLLKLSFQEIYVGKSEKIQFVFGFKTHETPEATIQAINDNTILKKWICVFKQITLYLDFRGFEADSNILGKHKQELYSAVRASYNAYLNEIFDHIATSFIINPLFTCDSWRPILKAIRSVKLLGKDHGSMNEQENRKLVEHKGFMANELENAGDLFKQYQDVQRRLYKKIFSDFPVDFSELLEGFRHPVTWELIKNFKTKPFEPFPFLLANKPYLHEFLHNYIKVFSSKLPDEFKNLCETHRIHRSGVLWFDILSSSATILQDSIASHDNTIRNLADKYDPVVNTVNILLGDPNHYSIVTLISDNIPPEIHQKINDLRAKVTVYTTNQLLVVINMTLIALTLFGGHFTHLISLLLVTLASNFIITYIEEVRRPKTSSWEDFGKKITSMFS